MMTEKKKNGGARPGAGRPKGSGNKITAQDLITAAEQVIGKSFVESLMEGYRQSIEERNTRVRVTYERLILDKVIADRQQIEVTDNRDLLEQRQLAFRQALDNIITEKPTAQ